MSYLSGRSTSGVDDIDGDDGPPATTTAVEEKQQATPLHTADNAAAVSSSETTVPPTAAPATAAAADVSPPRPRSRSRSPRLSPLDDIDGDDGPPHATAAAVAAHTAAEHAHAASASDSTDPIFPKSVPSNAYARPGAGSEALTPEGEVARILSVLRADADMAELSAATNPEVAAGGASTGVRAGQPVPDHFGVLGLPAPQVNAGGEGVWLVEDEELKRAYKQLVLVIHPDKNPAAGAKTAFEAVKAAHSTLTNDATRYDYIRAYVAFRDALAMRDPSFLPRALGVGSGTLEDTLAQGRALAAHKAKQTASVQAKLQAALGAKMAAARAGEAAKARAEQQARQDALKRKLMHTSKPVAAAAGKAAASKATSANSSDDSDDEGISVADRIKAAKGRQAKKIRML